ncbi:MAG: MATE family efflux transporter [Clostridia bacterium]|nr:MATE family efflux transporter [Clostridia bacterium]
MKMTAEQRAQMMLNESVSRIIPRLAVPTIISMLITTIYNMADTYFVSQLNTSASGAVGVVFSVMAIIQAVSFMLGMGTGTNLSQALGRGEQDQARVYGSVGFFTAIATGVVIMILGNLSLDWLIPLLGATDTILPYAKEYATYIFYAAPFMMGSLVMNNMLRFQGLATYGMVGVTAGGILNIILDPIFIYAPGAEIGFGLVMPFGLNLGTAGAAIATAISQAISFLILLAQCNLRKDTITLTPRLFRPTRHMYARILNNGLPSLGRQGIASISSILLNRAAGAYVAAAMADAAIAAMSIVSRFVMFINSTVIGFGQGFQPVCSFNYGAGRYSRVRQAFWFCVKVATVILLVLGSVAFIFAEPIITAFRKDDLDVIRIGAAALRFHLTTIPLWGFIVMSNMFTQSIGYGVRSTIISTARQGLFLIPALLLLPPLLGLTGIQMAQPVADVLALGLTIFIVGGILRKFRTMPDKDAPHQKA